MEKRSAQKKAGKYLSVIFPAVLNPFLNRRFIFFPVSFLGAATYGQAPNISYNSPRVLYMETPVSISPTNTGMPVFDSPGITYATVYGQPMRMVSDRAGNLYIADIENAAIKIILADSDTPVIVASTKGAGYPMNIAIDRAGTVISLRMVINTYKKYPLADTPSLNKLNHEKKCFLPVL